MTHYCECPMCPNQGSETDGCWCGRESSACNDICTLEAEVIHHANRANKLQAERDALGAEVVRLRAALVGLLHDVRPSQAAVDFAAAALNKKTES